MKQCGHDFLVCYVFIQTFMEIPWQRLHHHYQYESIFDTEMPNATMCPSQTQRQEMFSPTISKFMSGMIVGRKPCNVVNTLAALGE